jgi:tripartite-type tricarboxylate transporter receptor subunit TctC
MKRFVSLVFAAICTFGLAAAHAAGYPERVVTIVVPFPAGGTTDILARELAHQLSQRWKQPVIVENKGGASGSIGSRQVVQSPPDGYTLLLTATHHVINPSLLKNLPYDTKRDFTPLALIATVPNALVVNANFPARSVADLIRMAREKPGAISFGSAGIGGANHLSGELFKWMAGVDMTHVPYKGAAPAMNDLLGGQIPVMFDSIPGVLPHVQSGKLRALAVTTKTRVAALPGVPTMDEAGVKDFEATAWFGLYGPANMPLALRDKIGADVRAVLASDYIKEKFGKLGAEPGTPPPAEFAQFVNAEIDKWSQVIKRANITIDQ